MSARLIAIGDIHGCATALATLLDAIAPSADDTLVFLGDYIDRGPDSKGVIEQILALSSRCRVVPLLGNHEEMLLLALRNRTALECWLASGGVEALASYGFVAGQGSQRQLYDIVPESHWSFFANCQAFLETDAHFFVHAGYDPALPLEKQPAEALRWKFTDRKTAQPHCSGKTAIVGHTPQRSGRILDLGFLRCIDTNCQGGKWLTALEPTSGQVWQANERGKINSRG